MQIEAKKYSEMTMILLNICKTKLEFRKKDQGIERFYVEQM